MKTQKNNLVEIVILGVLGLLVVLSILIPQLLRDRGEPRLLSLSVLLRDTDSAAFAARRRGARTPSSSSRWTRPPCPPPWTSSPARPRWSAWAPAWTGGRGR